MAEGVEEWVEGGGLSPPPGALSPPVVRFERGARLLRPPVLPMLSLMVCPSSKDSIFLSSTWRRDLPLAWSLSSLPGEEREAPA